MTRPLTPPDASAHTSWVDVPAGSPFPLHNLPFGVGRRPDGSIGAFVAIGDSAFDLGMARSHLGGTAAADDLVDDRGTLTRFAGLGREANRGVRTRVADLLSDEAIEPTLRSAVIPIDELEMLVPVDVGDYVDFYSSLQHATNLGRMFRPDGDALLPNWRQLPVGYHGRTGTIVADGSTITRPRSLRLVDGIPVDGATRRLDIELEVGFVVGATSPRGTRVSTDRAETHLFGLCLVNDWSARDIQSYEYVPLGPFLGKSFATSMSPWIVTLDALAPFRIEPPDQDPLPSPHLRTTGATGFDLHLEVLLQTPSMREADLDPAVISRTGFADTYWTAAQQLAHLTANGAHVRPGDLFASGTVSGPTAGSEGSLIELTRNGERPIRLPDCSQRTFLEDGDTVTLRGWAGTDPNTRIGLGSVTGTIGPALDPDLDDHVNAHPTQED